MSVRVPLAVVAASLVASCTARAPDPVPDPAAAPEAVRSTRPLDRWYKGNTHTHTLWSDGDDFPEMVADWYREHGYDFLAITDHNTLAGEERWIRIPDEGEVATAYGKYRQRLGPSWVEERRAGDSLLVRLRRLDEYRARMQTPGRFVLVPGEEITQYLDRRGAHVNALNLPEVVPEQRGASLVEILRRDLAVLDSIERRTGREIVGVLNHPNFLWSQTAEDILALPELRFFEVYNGHPLVNVLGDSVHASSERIWDIVLARRLAAGGALLYGIATDDAHDYHAFAPSERNPGRGWVMVRADSLAPDALMAAMERGDFYASTGVELRALRRDGARLSLEVSAEPGATYTIQFVGTRAGHDTASVAVADSTGRPVTRRYSPQIGEVLAEVRGTSAEYTMRGDELYVRARVVSSRPKANESYPGEVEMAWTQPVRP